MPYQNKDVHQSVVEIEKWVLCYMGLKLQFPLLGQGAISSYKFQAV